MRDAALIVAAGCIVAGVWWWLRRDEGEVEETAGGGLLGEGMDIVTKATASLWEPPAAAAPYIGLIHSTEDRNGIPRNMLARLLWQESRFRTDIITGRVKSSAGALGIVHIGPADRTIRPDIDRHDRAQLVDPGCGSSGKASEILKSVGIEGRKGQCRRGEEQDCKKADNSRHDCLH